MRHSAKNVKSIPRGNHSMEKRYGNPRRCTTPELITLLEDRRPKSFVAHDLELERRISVLET
jgi:hypothetical protein